VALVGKILAEYPSSFILADKEVDTTNLADDTIMVFDSTADTFGFMAKGKRVFVQETAPTDPEVDDIWIKKI